MKNAWFIMALISLGITEIIVFLGNPPITEWFYWHHIPEIVGVLFFGMWFAEMRLRFRYVLAFGLIPSIIGGLRFRSLLAFFVAQPLMIPLILGYWAQRKSLSGKA